MFCKRDSSERQGKYMKKKLISDPEINKQFKHIAATEPWILSKASQIEAGIDKNNETPKKAFSYTS